MNKLFLTWKIGRYVLGWLEAFHDGKITEAEVIQMFNGLADIIGVKYRCVPQKIEGKSDA